MEIKLRIIIILSEKLIFFLFCNSMYEFMILVMVNVFSEKKRKKKEKVEVL